MEAEPALDFGFDVLVDQQLQAEQERRARLEADRRRTSEVDDLMDRLARRS